MKKGLKYLILGALLFPVAVKADMGAPDIFDVEVVCNKTEGCQQYEYDYTSKKLKEAGMASYGDRGKAQYSYAEDGKEYYSVYFNNKEYYVVKGEFVSVKAKVDTTDKSITKLVNPCSAMVSNKDGAKMYSGPHEAFETISTIPYGTKFNYEYAFMSYEGWGSTFVYATYKGKSGWISSDSIAKELSKTTKVKLDSELKYNDILIPANTELESKYAVYIEGDYYLYSKYDGKDVFFFDYYAPQETNKTYTLKKDIELVKDTKSNEKVKKLVKGSKVTINYVSSLARGSSEFDDIYYYINNAGWYKHTVYNDITKDNTLFDCESGYFVSSGSDFKDEVDLRNSIEKTTESTTNRTTETTVDLETTTITTYDTVIVDKDKKNNTTPITLIVMFVGIGVLMAFVSIVVIVTLNKKKKQNLDEQKSTTEEPKVEESAEQQNSNTSEQGK